MRFWIEYAGNGTVAFACHNVAETLTRDARTADRTTVSCSFNGYPSVPVDDGHDTFHATSAGVADAALGSTVQVCITATAWYFRFHATPYTYYNCADVTVAPAGTLYI
jgi:hypothetical protein